MSTQGLHIHYYSPPEVDRIWGIWGSYYNILKAKFYLLKGDYIPIPLPLTHTTNTIKPTMAIHSSASLCNPSFHVILLVHFPLDAPILPLSLKP